MKPEPLYLFYYLSYVLTPSETFIYDNIKKGKFYFVFRFLIFEDVDQNLVICIVSEALDMSIELYFNVCSPSSIAFVILPVSFISKPYIGAW